jgi:hypothetical protein
MTRAFTGSMPEEHPRSDVVDSGSADPLNSRTLAAGSLEHPVKYPFVEGPAAAFPCSTNTPIAVLSLRPDFHAVGPLRSE